MFVVILEPIYQDFRSHSIPKFVVISEPIYTDFRSHTVTYFVVISVPNYQVFRSHSVTKFVVISEPIYPDFRSHTVTYFAVISEPILSNLNPLFTKFVPPNSEKFYHWIRGYFTKLFEATFPVKSVPFCHLFLRHFTCNWLALDCHFRKNIIQVSLALSPFKILWLKIGAERPETHV